MASLLRKVDYGGGTSTPVSPRMSAMPLFRIAARATSFTQRELHAIL